MGEKTRELDVKASAAVEVEALRERWAEMQNRALALAQVPERVDHRSHKRQGIEQEPTVHMGPAATAIERRAEREAMQAGRDYEPVTLVGQHNAAAIEKRGLRQYIERGTEWLRDAGQHVQQVGRRLYDFAASLGGAIDNDQRAAAEAERAQREQERQAAERQRQAELAQKEMLVRDRVAGKFKEIAAMREMRAHGYGDQSANWKATPAALRKAVDDFNAAKQHTKDRFIESLQREPDLSRSVGQLIDQRDLAIKRDRGMSL